MLCKCVSLFCKFLCSILTSDDSLNNDYTAVLHNTTFSMFLNSMFHGKISVRITFIFRFHCRPIQLLVFVPVGLPSFLKESLKLQRSTAQAGCQKKLRKTNKTCRRFCKNEERPTGTNTTNWMGRRWSLKIKVITILIANMKLVIIVFLLIGLRSYFEEMCSDIIHVLSCEVYRIPCYVRQCHL